MLLISNSYYIINLKLTSQEENDFIDTQLEGNVEIVRESFCP